MVIHFGLFFQGFLCFFLGDGFKFIFESTGSNSRALWVPVALGGLFEEISILKAVFCSELSDEYSCVYFFSFKGSLVSGNVDFD